MIHQLVYVSQHNFGPEVTEPITEFLPKAVENNLKHGLTGVLLHDDHHFAQVLEGAQHDVETVFEKIQRDLRHNDVVIVYFREVQNRDFAMWSMTDVESYRALGAPSEELGTALEDPSKRSDIFGKIVSYIERA